MIDDRMLRVKLFADEKLWLVGRFREYYLFGQLFALGEFLVFPFILSFFQTIDPKIETQIEPRYQARNEMKYASLS